MNKSNRTQISHFQNFITRTFLDNLSLKKKSHRRFIFLCTPGQQFQHHKWCFWGHSTALYCILDLCSSIYFRTIKWTSVKFNSEAQYSLLHYCTQLCSTVQVSILFEYSLVYYSTDNYTTVYYSTYYYTTVYYSTDYYTTVYYSTYYSTTVYYSTDYYTTVYYSTDY